MIGVVWATAFVVLESTQFVFFGGLFQRMSPFLFGFLVFGVTAVVFIAWSILTVPAQVRAAFANPATLFAVNAAATLAVGAYLLSVQLIEPAVAYTISSGVMPITAYACHRFGVPEGEPMRNRAEAMGNLLLLAGVVYLAAVTISGWSGFVRGGADAALAGVLLAITDGVLFTWVLIYCQRLNRAGVGPAAVFGLRFPLYVIAAGSFVALGASQGAAMPLADIAWVVIIGLALTVPPLYALQKAVASLSTMTLSALTALGPFVIFALQVAEDRVDYSNATLAGLIVYFAGSILAATGAVSAAAKDST